MMENAVFVAGLGFRVYFISSKYNMRKECCVYFGEAILGRACWTQNGIFSFQFSSVFISRARFEDL